MFAAPADLPPDEPPFDGLFAEAEAATAAPIYETPKTKPRDRGSTPKRASACPFEFGAQVPDDYRAAAEKIGLGTGDVQRVFDKFCDHARGNGKTFKDWLAAWRTWCRNEVDWGKNRRPAAAPPPRNRPMQKEDMQHYTDDF
ncbi:hypothetical protein [Sutterella sp.]|uniref:hypothetical protein n=1 Tax=Sutterella sp. TaxID=1981025 RepID=UPI0026DF6979|nr:hypothetical protein [Sutterella sp.]MDO5531041.1 hypothetical protein [Sutterella sp.]